QIRQYNGNKFKAIDTARAGEIIAVTGLTEVCAGDPIGALTDGVEFDLIPTLTSKVIFDSTTHVKDVLRCFKMLDAEDPSLHVIWNEQVQEIHVHVMGVIQLEVLKQIVNERFQFDVSFGDPKILYKETIRGPVN